MHITAVRRDAPNQTDQTQIITLLVRNISESGLCCLAPEKIGSEKELMLFIPPQGGRGGRDIRCQVMRCVSLEDQYLLGLMFRDPLGEAAAQVH